MSSRREEILAKKARLAEIKKQRELRQQEFAAARQSFGEIGKTGSPRSSRVQSKEELDDLISSLLDRPSSSRQESPGPSPTSKPSRPTSLQSAGQISADVATSNTAPRASMQSASTQTLSADSPTTVFEVAPEAPPKKEVVTYSKAVQTVEIGTDTGTGTGGLQVVGENGEVSPKAQRERDEAIRESLRKEVEEELKATKGLASEGSLKPEAKQRYPLRQLTSDELNAVTSSTDFLSFIERSSKVIERALDDEYDILADYTLSKLDADNDDDDSPYARTSRKALSLKESVQFFDEKHCRKRQISDLQFSPQYQELFLSSYNRNPSAPNEAAGLVLLWNSHVPSRPEYTFTATSDVLSARFSPFHPQLVIGGSYSGQVLLWDMRTSGRTGAPVQKTPLSGSHLGHTHPVYSISIIGTPNAHNIITTSTDGVVCSWSIDMLSQPQEYLELTTPPPAKTEDLAPTTSAFPSSDPTFFVVGTEEGSIYPCHRYDRAGAKAGTDTRLAYRGHTAPIMSTHFHPARGPVDLSDLMLSSSIDWSLKLWRIRPAGASSAAAAAIAAATNSMASTSTTSGPQVITPLLDIPREDLVYDAKWSPHRPGVFACVTGAGDLEVFDLNLDLEVPVAKASPSRGKGVILTNGLNKLAWEEREGKKIAVGGLDGVVTVFDVGKGLSGASGQASMDEWAGVKRLVGRMEQGKI